MQFANDFEWIGDEIEIVWKNFNLEMPHEKESHELEIAINRMRNTGREARDRQVVGSLRLFLSSCC
jgi:hypothetical protein